MSESVSTSCAMLDKTTHMTPVKRDPQVNPVEESTMKIYRTAIFAWSPTSPLPLIATDTVAGALNESFSNDSQLEIWEPAFASQHEYYGTDDSSPKGVVKDTTRCVVQWLFTPRSRDGSPFPSPPGSTILHGDKCTSTARLASSPPVWETANSFSGTQPSLWNIQSRRTPMAHIFLINSPFFASVPRKPSSCATPFIQAPCAASISTPSRQTFCRRVPSTEKLVSLSS